MKREKVKAIVITPLFAACLLAGCGGGSMGSTPPPTTTTSPPTPTGITVTCMSPVQSGAMDQCSAVITPSGATQTATWAASGGTAISSGGMLTAPTVTAKTNVTVTATAGSVSGMFIVEVDPPAAPSPTPTPTGVSVTCQSPIQSATTDQCSAVVTPSGVSQTVTWTTAGGTISAGGVLTAPTVTAKTNVVVTASIGNISGMFAVEVDPSAPPPPPAPTGVNVACKTPVQSGTTDLCSATVTPSGASQTVTWKASGATISAAGLLTAPTITAKINVVVTATAGTASGMFTVEVDPPSPTTAPPSALSYTSPVTATVGTALMALSPTVTGTVTSYLVTPTLPAGLLLNSTSGVISGTPTVSAAQATYTIKATNTSGSTTFALSLTVNPAAPTGLSYPGPLQATVGVALTLTPVVNGTVTGYSVSPALPPGLMLNATTGVVFGTPTTVTAQAAYVFKASNASGSTTFSLTITVGAPAASGMIATSANSLTFDNQLVATTSAAQPLAIINTGTNTLTISAVNLAGGSPSSFSADSGDCTSLASRGTCLIKVKFTPGGLGPQTAQMNISTSATAAPTQVLLSGSGVAASMTFDNFMIPVGQSATLTWNAPNATSCTAGGSWTGSQAINGTQTFTPNAAGYYPYVLTCPNPLDPNGNNSQSVTLTAYGLTPTVVEPPNNMGFQAAFFVAPPNEYVGLQTNLIVPPLPATPTTPGAAIFLWPGLDPATNSLNFLPIDNGVLQPVLSFGPSCAPTQQPTPFSSWWISGQYVNTFGSDPGFTGCFSGNSISVNPGDVLLLNMVLDSNSNIWTELITDVNEIQSVTFSFNLQGQGQNWAYFAIEEWFGAIISTPVTFSRTALTLQAPNAAAACTDTQSANNAFILSLPTAQNNNSQCFIRSIVVTQH